MQGAPARGRPPCWSVSTAIVTAIPRARFGNSEEYLATTIANIYLSEKGEPLRGVYSPLENSGRELTLMGKATFWVIDPMPKGFAVIPAGALNAAIQGCKSGVRQLGSCSSPEQPGICVSKPLCCDAGQSDHVHLSGESAGPPRLAAAPIGNSAMGRKRA